MKPAPLKLEHRLILEMIPRGASVLDLGCGDGELLSALVSEKGSRAQGIEIDEQAIYKCVAAGLSVLHGDIDTGLPEYGDKSFNYVILDQSLQQVMSPDTVLREALRVGKWVIVGFPNFANLSARCQLFFRGRTPVTPSLPYEWHDTPNLHFLSISDFVEYCRRRSIKIERRVFASDKRQVKLFPNVLASVGVFLLSNGEPASGATS
ncbi:MAG: methionine biosynthesis protein MetW [Isosphaeraceae bacterium]